MTAADAGEHTGLSPRRLRYWRATGFFSGSGGADGATHYTDTDVRALHAIAALRASGCSLQHLRRVGERLAAGSTPWDAAGLCALDRRVLRRDPRTGALEDVLTGQTVLPISGASDPQTRMPATTSSSVMSR